MEYPMASDKKLIDQLLTEYPNPLMQEGHVSIPLIDKSLEAPCFRASYEEAGKLTMKTVCSSIQQVCSPKQGGKFTTIWRFSIRPDRANNLTYSSTIADEKKGKDGDAKTNS